MIEQSYVQEQVFEAGTFGPEEAEGQHYIGPFGPCDLAQLEEKTATRLRGSEVGEGELAWGRQSKITIKDPSGVLRKTGVDGNVGGYSFRVTQRPGLRRSRRILCVDIEQRTTRWLRVRGWGSLSLESGDGTRLASRNRWNSVKVEAAADRVDVGLLLLLTASNLHEEIWLGWWRP